MYKVYYTNKFKKQYELMKKRGLKMALLDDIIIDLAQGKKLPAKNNDHDLRADYIGFRECHIQPDWLLIYYVEEDVITFDSTGSHSDLF